MGTCECDLTGSKFFADIIKLKRGHAALGGWGVEEALIP